MTAAGPAGAGEAEVVGLAVGMEDAGGVAEVEEPGEGEDLQVVASSRPAECAVLQTVPRNEKKGSSSSSSSKIEHEICTATMCLSFNRLCSSHSIGLPFDPHSGAIVTLGSSRVVLPSRTALRRPIS